MEYSCQFFFEWKIRFMVKRIEHIIQNEISSLCEIGANSYFRFMMISS